MKVLVHFLILVSWVSRCSVIEDASKLFESFEKGTDATSNILKEIKFGKASSLDFLAAAFKFGSGLSGALHIAGKNETDLYKAMQQFHTNLTIQINKMNGWSIFVIKELETIRALENYRDNVVLPIRYFDRDIEFLSNPAKNKSRAMIEDFSSECKARHTGILGILDRMDLLLTHCSNFSKLSEGIQLKLINILIDLQKFHVKDRKLNSVQLEELNEILFHLRVQLNDAKDDADRLLIRSFNTILSEQINQTAEFPNIVEATRALHRQLKKTGPNTQPQCIPELIFNHRRYQEKPLKEFLKLVERNLKSLELYSGICANISMHGTEMDMYKFGNQTFNYTNKIREFILHWVPQQISDVWPRYDELEVRKILALYFPAGAADNSTEFTRAADLIRDAIVSTGNSSYVKQAIVSVNKELRTEYYYNCPEDRCFTILNYLGMNILITRFEEKHKENTAGAIHYYRKKQQMIRRVIDEQKGIDSMKNLTVVLKKDFNLTGDGLHTSFLAVRDKTCFDWSECHLSFGVWGSTAMSNNSLVQTYKQMSYKDPGFCLFGGKGCVTVVLHFFL